MGLRPEPHAGLVGPLRPVARPGVAPRTAMRRASQARRGSIQAVCDRDATPVVRMQRRSNAAGLLPRAASPTPPRGARTCAPGSVPDGAAPRTPRGASGAPAARRKTRRCTENGDAPGQPGASREHTGRMRPRRNAGGPDAAPFECRGALATGCQPHAAPRGAPGLSSTAGYGLLALWAGRIARIDQRPAQTTLEPSGACGPEPGAGC